MRNGTAHVAFGSSDSLGPCDFKDFVAQSHTPHDHCVRFAVVVTFPDATLVTRRALPLTWAGLSPAGSRQLRLAHHYGFTKTAVLAIARGLAKRTAGTGVTVNSVLPGPTFSEGVEDMLKGMAQNTGQSIEQAALAFVKADRPSSIIGRMATPEEVANMVVYAVSPTGLGNDRRRAAG